ncbi:MAG: hypothetical protein H6861_03850 [Rhodospirillales bacterium]|nr:hypothetical protein [Rhodospirillales bacterium]
MKYLALIACLLLTACGDYRTPTASQDPAKLSDHTLCYRAQTTGKGELKAEAAKRNLDCRAEIENDPLLTNQRY